MDIETSGRHGILLKAVRSSPLSIFSQDANLVYRWVENSQFDWLQDSVVGKTDADIFDPDTAARSEAAKRRAMESGDDQRLEFALDDGAERRWFEVFVSPDVDRDGTPLGVICWALEITDRMRREVLLKTLLREVSHRSKNLMAMVLSIAMQTGRSSVTIGQFVQRFAGRVQSMAKSQDLITDSDWRGATMTELVQKQVFGISAGFAGRIRYDGDEIDFPPNAALHIGLALHELTTNALGYGALSGASGIVRIDAHRRSHDGKRLVEIEWREIGGPQIAALPEKRFGSVTLERVVPAAVGGEGQLDFGYDGLSYRLLIPDQR